MSTSANLGPKLTGGLPKVIQIWHKPLRSKLGPRIRASFCADRFDQKQSVSITVSIKPRIVFPKDFEFGSHFTENDFDMIKDWIIARQDRLQKYWSDSSMTIDNIID